ncbi:DUF262 domain-containing protein [Vagococcus fluvialis]|uniref:DUF262 domain-containing protein n=1 Tax=Vagococcus fluvialis TaxID=2738 RepID=UPI001A8C6639|nr:DUF262 domain-containing protein [Vagococcus fluvialis]MBO0443786.1 DUF262 domain-containing protein [Vagococcus fluvialis]
MTEQILNQIKENRSKFRVDHFDIVVSEYVNRYNDRKIILDPPYQREFRWDIIKQSALIESILIGIPLPPIFAFSNDDYNWEIIDGLQRTTTLIRFINEIDNENSDIKFEGCEILTSLNGKRMSELGSSVLNNLKNARLRIELVEDNDDLYSQYLLFSRLNNNGEDLSPQELRNFLVYKLSPMFYTRMNNFRTNTDFEESIGLKSQRVLKQEDNEYILRYFICQMIMLNETEEKTYKTIDALITKEIQNYLYNIHENRIIHDFDNITQTYTFIRNLLGKNSFRYFHKNINNITNTSVIAPAIGLLLDEFTNIDKESAISILDKFFKSDVYRSLTNRSYSPTRRYFKLSVAAYEFFQNELGDIN